MKKIILLLSTGLVVVPLLLVNGAVMNTVNPGPSTPAYNPSPVGGPFNSGADTASQEQPSAGSSYVEAQRDPTEANADNGYLESSDEYDNPDMYTLDSGLADEDFSNSSSESALSGSGGASNGAITLGGAANGTAAPGGAANGALTPGSASNGSASGLFSNPLKEKGDVFTVAKKLMETVVVPIAGVCIVLAIFWSGFMFLVAQGKPEELKTAKKNFMYVLIGSILILGSWLIMNGIKDTITGLLS
ncbi:MAG: pilin [Candidatus Paceibacterota bacterium]|jgi:hypothetical protein